MPSTWLIVLGGPMNVYEEDEYPWLTDEKTFHRKGPQAGERVFWHLFGCAVDRECLGRRFRRNPKRRSDGSLWSRWMMSEKQLFSNICPERSRLSLAWRHL